MALNYPFVYRIFSWCAKGIVIFLNETSAVRRLENAFGNYIVPRYIA